MDQWVLYELLRHGVVDPRPRDRAFDASTRAMRYSAAITDRVWSLLDKETTIPYVFPLLMIRTHTLCFLS